MKYWKITNQSEKHYDMQYRTGLNVDVLPFYPYGDCEPGGIYYSDTTHILAFLDTPSGPGKWIREVTLPEGDLAYENPGYPKKWKAHRVILGERKEITAEVIEELLDHGAKIHPGGDLALCHMAEAGRTDVHAWHDRALSYAAAEAGRTDIVELLLDRGADVHAWHDRALRWAAKYGHTDTVKLLLDRGADIHANNDWALRWAAGSGHTDTVELLLNRGAHRQKIWGY